jgi:hypothetical protein
VGVFNVLSVAMEEAAPPVGTSSDKPTIEMIIGDSYLDDLGKPTRDQTTRLAKRLLLNCKAGGSAMSSVRWRNGNPWMTFAI